MELPQLPQAAVLLLFFGVSGLLPSALVSGSSPRFQWQSWMPRSSSARRSQTAICKQPLRAILKESLVLHPDRDLINALLRVSGPCRCHEIWQSQGHGHHQDQRKVLVHRTTVAARPLLASLELGSFWAHLAKPNGCAADVKVTCGKAALAGMRTWCSSTIMCESERFLLLVLEYCNHACSTHAGRIERVPWT